MKPVYLWWLNQEDCEAIGDDLPNGCPKYLRDQYQIRLGRPGRGRLWVASGMGDVKVDPWPDSPLGRRLINGYGGIAIHESEIAGLKQLPGILTDLRLNRI